MNSIKHLGKKQKQFSISSFRKLKTEKYFPTYSEKLALEKDITRNKNYRSIFSQI